MSEVEQHYENSRKNYLKEKHSGESHIAYYQNKFPNHYQTLIELSYNLHKLFKDHGEFSLKTFGDRPPTAPLHHLKKEIEEAIAEPYEFSEHADILLLLVDAHRLAGGSAYTLLQEAFKKLEINKQRNWGEPDENGVFLHKK